MGGRGKRSGGTRGAALAVAVLTLGVGPWLGLPGSTFPVGDTAFAAVARQLPVRAQHQVGVNTPASPRLSTATGCGCREVVVDATNVSRGADLRTGDAKVVNKTITYIAPTYGDVDVEVKQKAEARSGDAIAGQILAVDGGEGCSRVRVTAKNIVEDAKLRTGDALARNKSVILLAPSINREDLEIEVKQKAVAESGNAIAGQVIGVRGGGPCGGVIVDALNRVRNVDLRTGEATIENMSSILTCEDEGCIADLRRLLFNVESVDVCDADGCRSVEKKEFIRMLRNPSPSGEDPGGDDDVDDPRSRRGDRSEILDDPKVKEAQPWRYPRPKPRRSPDAATETAVAEDGPDESSG